VRLDLHDLNGRAIRTALDADVEAGPHRVRIATGGLPSGVYILRLTTPGAMSARAVIVAH